MLNNNPADACNNLIDLAKKVRHNQPGYNSNSSRGHEKKKNTQQRDEAPYLDSKREQTLYSNKIYMNLMYHDAEGHKDLKLERCSSNICCDIITVNKLNDRKFESDGVGAKQLKQQLFGSRRLCDLFERDFLQLDPVAFF